MKKLIILFFLLGSFLYSTELEVDTFDHNLEGWSGSGVYRSWYSGSYRMKIKKDKIARKTFNFGTANKKKSLKLSFDLLVVGGWETSGAYKDFLKIWANGTQILNESYSDGFRHIELNITTNNKGKVKIKIKPDTTVWKEIAYIDNIKIETISSSTPPTTIINNADDLCYEDVIGSGMMCFDMGICYGGVGCKNIIPLRNVGDKTISDVNVFYDESGMSMSFGNHCGVTPSGSCETNNSVIDMGVFGTLSKSTHFIIDNSIPVGDNSNRVWTSTFVGMSCFGTNKFYATYVKDGVKYKGVLAKCNTIGGSGFRDFEIVNPESTRNINGDYLVTGNTIECVTTSTNSYGGSCTDNHSLNDNSRMTKYIDIDSDPNTWNSSSAYLNLPSDFSQVVWAGLFWQGNVNNRASGYHQRRAYKTSSGWSYKNITSSSSVYPTSPNVDADKVLFKIDGMSSYKQVKAQKFDWDKWYQRNGGGDKGFTYSAYSDVTDIFNTYNSSLEPNKKITVTVANLTANEGRENWLGNFGGWSLVVVYKGDINSTFKRVLIYSGYKSLDDPSYTRENINVNSLYLPTGGNVNSQFSVFAGEGEETYSPDSMKLADHNMPGARDQNNIFDARLANIERPSIGDNDVENANGIDIDTYDVTPIMTAVRNSNPSASSVILSLTTDWDTYYPSMIGFSVELYQPKVCYEATYYDENGNEIDENSHIGVGDKIRVHLVVKNDDNEVARYVQIRKIFDDNKTSYIPNTTCVKDVEDTKEICHEENDSMVKYNDTTKTLTIGYIGEGTPPLFQPIGTNPDHIVNIDYNITIDSSETINFSYETSYIFEIGGQIFNFNGRLPQCVDFNDSLNPYSTPVGSFNIVESSFSGTNDPLDLNNSINAIHTKIVKKPFNMKVLHLGNDYQTLEDFQGVGFLEVVKALNIKESDVSSCENAPILYQLPPKTYPIIFGLDNLNKTSQQNVNNIIIPYANKNVAFRYKYIKWDNLISKKGIPCPNRSLNGNLKGVPQCLNSISKIEQLFPNTKCLDASTGAPCSPSHHGIGIPPYDHQYGCLQCLMEEGNTTSICSRDNFAIRPKKFAIYGNGVAKAGDNINFLTIMGLDYLDNNALDYTLQSGDINLSVSENNSMCREDNLSYSFTFYDGIATLNYIKYPEVGAITFTIKEKNGSEWAFVDAKDTPDSDRFITPATSNLVRVIPYNFQFNDIQIGDFQDGNFTYLSRDLSMAGEFNTTISAVNKNGEITKNYSNSCYAQNGEVNITHSDVNTTNLSKIITQFGENSKDENISFIIPKTGFNDGNYSLNLKINFDRNSSKMVEPFEFNLNSIKIVDSNNTTGTSNITNTPIHYYYAIIDGGNAITFRNNVDMFAKVKIYQNGKWNPAIFHNDKKYGYIFGAWTISPISLLFNENNITNGIQDIYISTTLKIRPYKAVVHFMIPNWLWYSKKGYSYVIPDGSHTDCATHPCSNVLFKKVGTNYWGGKGTNENENNASKQSVNIELQKLDKKEEYQRINW